MKYKLTGKSARIFSDLLDDHCYRTIEKVGDRLLFLQNKIGLRDVTISGLKEDLRVAKEVINGR